MNKTNFVITLLLAALGIMAASVGSQSWYRGDALLTGVQLTSGRDAPVLITQDQNVEVEVITATAQGFEPTAITRPRGPFVLALHNRSGEEDLALRVYRVSGEQVHEVRLRTGRRTQHQRLDLPAGEYLIAEADHPEWRCRLTINR